MFKKIIITSVAFLAFALPSQAFAKAQDIVKINTNVDVSRETTAGEVVVIGGDVTVFGTVANNLVVIGGSADLKRSAKIGGQIVVVGGDLKKEDGAEIAGRITQVYMPRFIPSFNTFLKGGWITLWATISLLALLGFIGLAILIAALVPEHLGTMVNALEKSFVTMFFWGVLWIILIVPIMLILAISIVGIMLIPLQILIVVLALVLGYISAAIFIGKNVLLAFKKIPPPFVDAILGIAVLFLVGFIPIIGPIIKAVFLIAGYGAVLTTKFGTLK